MLSMDHPNSPFVRALLYELRSSGYEPKFEEALAALASVSQPLCWRAVKSIHSRRIRPCVDP